METRYFSLFNLENSASAQKIQSELEQIVGVSRVEINFEAQRMVLEAKKEAMPRIINAAIMIIEILDHRITVMEERAGK